MDNLSAQNVTDIREAITAVGTAADTVAMRPVLKSRASVTHHFANRYFATISARSRPINCGVSKLP